MGLSEQRTVQSSDCPNDTLPTNGRRPATAPPGRPVTGRVSPGCPGGSWHWAGRRPLLGPRGEAETTPREPAAAVGVGSAGQRVLEGSAPPKCGRQQGRTPSGTGRHGRGLLSRPRWTVPTPHLRPQRGHRIHGVCAVKPAVCSPRALGSVSAGSRPAGAGTREDALDGRARQSWAAPRTFPQPPQAGGQASRQRRRARGLGHRAPTPHGTVCKPRMRASPLGPL